MKACQKMESKYLMLFLVLSVISQTTGNSVFNWFWGKESAEETVPLDSLSLISVPYESLTNDEKFLKSAAEFTDIQISSPLEICQHKVILKIKTSCSSMTEEELGKLSVNLLNCQSAVEGRKMFPCTAEMTLKECTTSMDADMWNVYHLMSNRARAVCYAARSTQFRALTELTVNKLMQTAHTQINALSSLKESQQRLEEQTSEALSSLANSNKMLLLQQQHLKDAQASAYNLVTSNLRELTNEKALIRSGHTQLGAMLEDIGKKLEEARKKLEEQTMALGENHKEIVEDLQSIHADALDRYEQTLEMISQINDSLQFIWNITNTMRQEIDRKLSWITDYIDDTGEQMQKISHSGLHVLYIMVAMIVAAFLQAPFITRLTIMGLVPLNLASYLKHGAEASLDFFSMTALIFFITAMHYLMVGIQYVFGPKTKIQKRLESANVVHLNGHSNGIAYTSSPKFNLEVKSKARLPLLSLYYMKLKETGRVFSNTINYQLNSFVQGCAFLFQSITSWIKPGSTQGEELSCSYISSKRSREKLIHSYEGELSDDVTDIEYSLINGNTGYIDDPDNLSDAWELRRRLRDVDGSVNRSYSCEVSSSSRNGSPSRQGRITCKATTQQGKPCRRYPINSENSEYCFLHHPGLSHL